MKTFLYVTSALALILVGLVAVSPDARAFAQSSLAAASTTATSSATAAPPATLAGSARDQYNLIKQDLYGMDDLFGTAAGYRSLYVAFMNSGATANRSTTELHNSLDVFDSFISQAQSARQAGIVALDGTSGFDGSGNVVNLDVVQNETQSAESDLLTARGLVISAINELHSGLNLFHQIYDVAVPDVPKQYASGLNQIVSSTSATSSAAATSSSTASSSAVALPEFSSLSAKDQARSRRILARYDMLRGDVDSLQALYDQAAAERQVYLSFLNGEAAQGKSTTELQNSLNTFDAFFKAGQSTEKDAVGLLDDRSGFDSAGNVVLLDSVEGNTYTALGDFLSARIGLENAVAELHSGLNLFHQVNATVTVPDIPKIHFGTYFLTAS